MERDDKQSEEIEKQYFDFLLAAACLGLEARIQENHCNFVGNEPKVIKDYLTDMKRMVDQVNKKFAMVVASANEAHNLGI